MNGVWHTSLFSDWAERSAYSLLTPNLSAVVIGWRNWLVDLQLPFHSVRLFPGCYSSACLRVWLASFNFSQLVRSIRTSSASLLVEWRMKTSREQKTLVKQCYLKTFSCSRKQTATRQPLFETKTVGLHNTDVWIWIAIFQRAEYTWILELLMTG